MKTLCCNNVIKKAALISGGLSTDFDYGVGVATGVPAEPAAGVGVTESFAASAAVCGIPFMIQSLNMLMISGLTWLLGGMARINV